MWIYEYEPQPVLHANKLKGPTDAKLDQRLVHTSPSFCRTAGNFPNLSLPGFIRRAKAGIWLSYWGSTRPTFDFPRYEYLVQRVAALLSEMLIIISLDFYYNYGPAISSQLVAVMNFFEIFVIPSTSIFQ